MWEEEKEVFATRTDCVSPSATKRCAESRSERREEAIFLSLGEEEEVEEDEEDVEGTGRPV